MAGQESGKAARRSDPLERILRRATRRVERFRKPRGNASSMFFVETTRGECATRSRFFCTEAPSRCEKG